MLGESNKNPRVLLFLCYQNGRDGLGNIRNLEVGAVDDKYTEELEQQLCGRTLFDESFNHIVATPGGPTLKINKPETPSAELVEEMYVQLKTSTDPIPAKTI